MKYNIKPPICLLYLRVELFKFARLISVYESRDVVRKAIWIVLI